MSQQFHDFSDTITKKCNLNISKKVTKSSKVSSFFLKNIDKFDSTRKVSKNSFRARFESFQLSPIFRIESY